MAGVITAGDQLRGIDPARMEHIIVTSFLNARRFGALLDEIEPSMNALKREALILADTLASMDRKSEGFAELVASLRQTNSEYGRLRDTFAQDMPGLWALYEHSGQVLAQLRSELSGLSLSVDALSLEMQALTGRLPEGVGEKFSRASSQALASIAQLDQSIAQLEDLAARVSKGQGTVGALINDPEFSDDAKKLGRYLKRHPWRLLTKPGDR